MKYKSILISFFALPFILNAFAGIAPAQATTTVIVNSTDDTVADDGQCTLREAIISANTDTASGVTVGECVAGSGDDTIDLTGIVSTINLTTSLPSIASNVIFNGPGASNLTLRRDSGGNYRILTVDGGATVTISGLTISNGSVVNGFGGGIHNAGTLTLNSSIVSNNSTNTSVVLGGHGGGIYNAGTLTLNSSTVSNNSIHTTARDSYGGGIYNAGTLTLTDSTVSGNDTFGNRGHGGGIFNIGTLTLNNSTVSDNSASTFGFNGDGGAIESVGSGSAVLLNNSIISNNRSNGGGSGGGIWNSDGATMELNNCTVSGNMSTNNGGGINNSRNATLRLNDTIIRDNSANGRGGGIWNDLGSTVELADSTVGGNNASTGGGIFNDSNSDAELVSSIVNTNNAVAGAGIFNAGGTVELTHSAISGNSAETSGGGIKNDNGGTVKLTDSTVSDNIATTIDGGGIDNLGTAQLANSTISGNTAGRDGGGIDNFEDSTVQLINCTVSGNTAEYGGGIANQGMVRLIHCTISSNSAGGGSGIHNFFSRTVELTNTIVASQIVGTDCGGDPVTSNGYNLDGDSTCNLTEPTDIPGTDPLLGRLQDNGGPTKTHALLVSSPAIDAAGNNGCPAADQRGKPRPVDGDGDGTTACDIGAFELQEGETVITLLSFTAQASAEHIILVWETGTEVDNAGFNFWRSEAVEGPYTKINETFILAEGDPVSGASYAYTDTNIIRGVTYYYKLEDVDLYGVSTFHGPVSATPSLILPIYLPLVLK